MTKVKHHLIDKIGFYRRVFCSAIPGFDQNLQRKPSGSSQKKTKWFSGFETGFQERFPEIFIVARTVGKMLTVGEECKQTAGQNVLLAGLKRLALQRLRVSVIRTSEPTQVTELHQTHRTHNSCRWNRSRKLF